MSVSIRLAESADLSKCLELLNILVGASDNDHGLFDASTFNELISKARGCLVVAEEDGDLLGMASISFNLVSLYFCSFFSDFLMQSQLKKLNYKEDIQ